MEFAVLAVELIALLADGKQLAVESTILVLMGLVLQWSRVVEVLSVPYLPISFGRNHVVASFAAFGQRDWLLAANCSILCSRLYSKETALH